MVIDQQVLSFLRGVKRENKKKAEKKTKKQILRLLNKVEKLREKIKKLTPPREGLYVGPFANIKQDMMNEGRAKLEYLKNEIIYFLEKEKENQELYELVEELEELVKEKEEECRLKARAKRRKK